MGELRIAGGATSAPQPISADHDCSSFDCGAAPLDDWLKHRALKSECRHARTYVICGGAGMVVGYYCILAGSVQRVEVPKKLRRNAPEDIPVAVIGRLAVDRSMQGKGLGADLLADALIRVAAASRSIGIAAVLLHAKDEAAKRFYLAQAEYLEFPEGGRTLFLPIETVTEALR